MLRVGKILFEVNHKEFYFLGQPIKCELILLRYLSIFRQSFGIRPSKYIGILLSCSHNSGLLCNHSAKRRRIHRCPRSCHLQSRAGSRLYSDILPACSDTFGCPNMLFVGLSLHIRPCPRTRTRRSRDSQICTRICTFLVVKLVLNENNSRQAYREY